MSTFKRLLNVGKGKARVAKRGLEDAVRPPGPGMIDDARHAAADAAEALADAIRPAETETETDTEATPEPAAEAEPDEPDEASPKPRGPRKRRL